MKALPSMKSPYTLVSFVAGMAMFAALPAFAQDTPDTTPAATTSDASAPPAAATTKMSSTQQTEVDSRIKRLHDQLKITPAEEDAWSKVAQVMQDNATAMSGLMDNRQSQTSMTALDDLKSYQAITQAHADGLKSLVEAFEPLYSAMSPDQQKNADKVFARHIEKKSKK